MTPTVIDTLKACAGWLEVATRWSISDKTTAELRALRTEVVTLLGHSGAMPRLMDENDRPTEPATPAQVLDMISEWRRGCSNVLGGQSAAECQDCTVGLIDAIQSRVSAYVVVTGEAPLNRYQRAFVIEYVTETPDGSLEVTRRGRSDYPEWVLDGGRCSSCQGSGKIIGYQEDLPCSFCRGSGRPQGGKTWLPDALSDNLAQPAAVVNRQDRIAVSRALDGLKDRLFDANALDAEAVALHSAGCEAFLRITAQASAKPAQPAEFADGLTATTFICHLIDRHEGEKVTEESLQSWLAEALALPRSNSPEIPDSSIVPRALADVVRAIRRFDECAEDGEDVNLSRDWFDALTTIGLLARVQRSPARWEMTGAGHSLLNLSAPTVPREWISEQVGGDYDDITAGQGYRRGWNDCRKSMVAASPVSNLETAVDVPDGWELVPLEPTIEMLMAGRKRTVVDMRGEYMGPSAENTFKAMLAAAPAPGKGGEA